MKKGVKKFIFLYMNNEERSKKLTNLSLLTCGRKRLFFSFYIRVNAKRKFVSLLFFVWNLSPRRGIDSGHIFRYPTPYHQHNILWTSWRFIQPPCKLFSLNICLLRQELLLSEWSIIHDPH